MANNEDSDTRLEEGASQLAALDASIMRGLADADADRVHELEDVAKALDAKYAAMGKSGE